jgi:hypothetical protein
MNCLMMAESTPLYSPTNEKKDTCNPIFLDDLFGDVQRIEVDLGFAGMLTFVLNDDFGGIDGLNDGRCDTA